MPMYLTLDKGTMRGGKSSALCTWYRRYLPLKGSKILVVKPAKDTRWSPMYVTTHDGTQIPCTTIGNLMDIDVSLWNIIIIDEGQWFDDLLQFIETHFYTTSLSVHVAGLNGDKHQRNFGQINMISPYCSKEIIHYSICIICGNDAPFTKERIPSVDRDIPGDMDRYYTVCHKHINVSPD